MPRVQTLEDHDFIKPSMEAIDTRLYFMCLVGYCGAGFQRAIDDALLLVVAKTTKHGTGECE